ncbi:MAG: alpha/beta fold hydrolase [Acidobacteria bacterium]|nr:alpha/beta fold hydrolase [Acidobacteriota bacterium]
MKGVQVRLGLLMLCATAVGAQTASYEGDWIGTLKVGPTKLRIGLHVTQKDGAWTGKLDSLDQGAMGIPIDSVTVTSGLQFEIKALRAHYEGSLNDGKIDGKFSQAGMTFPLVFERGKGKEPSRPQNPVGPVPYGSEEVVVRNGDIQLAGTFTSPKQGGPFTAVLLVTGSGPQDRDETLFGHKPFLVIADYLTRAGCAVLRLDDRGMGKSTGDFRTAGLAEFTSDALAAVAWLKARPEVKRAGILGHSEGGAVGPLAAVKSDDVAFLIMLAGPAQPFDELLVEQSSGLMRAAGVPANIIDANSQIVRAVTEVVRKEPDNAKALEAMKKIAAEWKDKQPQLASQLEGQAGGMVSVEMRSLLAYSAPETLGKLRCPVLALYGGKDLQVPGDSNLKAAAAALAAGHVEAVTLVKLPGVNHLFQTARTGALAEYGQSEETISPRALETIGNWLKTNIN